MTSNTTFAIPADFIWQPEFDSLLEHISSTDLVEVEWEVLRNIIKYKLEKHIADFLREEPPAKENQIFPEQYTVNGGLKLPPFLPRRPDGRIVNEIPIVYMNEQQANEQRELIFAQLHQFDDGPPFTIQRLCELCLRPREHYKAIGKFLRAVEKTVLVTSNHAAFSSMAAMTAQPSILSAAAPLLSTSPLTPLFSPIPFLHEDARRSKSRSPSPSLLALSSSPEMGKGLGLVDELDDPRPGHLSDHVTPLTATTSSVDTVSRPFLGCSEDRFVRAEVQEGVNTGEDGSTRPQLSDDRNVENKT